MNYRGALPSDAFVRWRNGIEVAQGVGWQLGRHEPEGGVFAGVSYIEGAMRSAAEAAAAISAA